METDTEYNFVAGFKTLQDKITQWIRIRESGGEHASDAWDEMIQAESDFVSHLMNDLQKPPHRIRYDGLVYQVDYDQKTLNYLHARDIADFDNPGYRKIYKRVGDE